MVILLIQCQWHWPPALNMDTNRRLEKQNSPNQATFSQIWGGREWGRQWSCIVASHPTQEESEPKPNYPHIAVKMLNLAHFSTYRIQFCQFFSWAKVYYFKLVIKETNWRKQKAEAFITIDIFTTMATWSASPKNVGHCSALDGYWGNTGEKCCFFNPSLCHALVQGLQASGFQYSFGLG